MKSFVHGMLVTLAFATIGPAHAESVTITPSAVKFSTEIAYIEPGDEITWTNMNAHNVETLPAMSPEGFEQHTSEVGADVTLKFDEPGIIVYKCTPHWGARMGGIIVVGEPEDPKGTINAYMEAIETDRAGLLPAKGLLKDALADFESKGL